MNKLLIPLLLAAGTVGFAEDKPAAATPVPADPAEVCRKLSEAVGFDMAQFIKNRGFDCEAVVSGIKKGYAGEKGPGREEMIALQKAFEKNRNASKDAEGGTWKQAQGLPASVHDDFYKEFCARKGVTVTASGLAYEVLKAAEGAKPAETDTVRVHYTGRHTTGSVFDSSVERGEPAEFPLNGVIKGWTEGVQLMTVGSKFRFVIPGKLAYGELKEGSQRPTGVLLFDVELLDIKK